MHPIAMFDYRIIPFIPFMPSLKPSEDDLAMLGYDQLLLVRCIMCIYICNYIYMQMFYYIIRPSIQNFG